MKVVEFGVLLDTASLQLVIPVFFL